LTPLSRNRNWGHPELIQFIEQLSETAARNGWRGLLIGDMAQPPADRRTYQPSGRSRRRYLAQ
jgi:murein endopeptidase